jgi:acyl-CoA reductase-like NAD-dependent aldehyde dehydrogenase
MAARAGKNLKKSSMELGGSDAFIVLDDADLDKTIPWAVWGRMYNGGPDLLCRQALHRARNRSPTSSWRSSRPRSRCKAR